MEQKPFEKEPSQEQPEQAVQPEMPEQTKEKAASETQESPEQELAFDRQAALEQEKSVLDKFTGRAKKAARVLVFVSLLSAGCGVASEKYPKEIKKERPKVAATTKQTQPKTREQIQPRQKQEQKINETNLTESSTWSKEIVASAQADRAKIKTAEDAEWLVRTNFNQLISEFYLPSQGELKEGPYGLKIREYTPEDTALLLQKAKEMESLLDELHAKYNLQAYENRKAQIQDMIKKLEWQSSYAGQKQKEALEKTEKLLQGR